MRGYFISQNVHKGFPSFRQIYTEKELIILPWWIKNAWDWFWYYRRGKIRFYVWDLGDTYNVSASNGKMIVYNCYGSTPESAKEMALYRLKKALNEEPRETEIIYTTEDFTLYMKK